ncbi:MAG TPA: sodium-dependent transporter [Myxococcota bacterium]|nr:sodium-dependent transporter [Myxococcota bacterium]
MSERWSGRAGFILAATASAVGLGSIWKFPYEVGANGGAAFILFYLAGLALIVVPLMLAEFAVGRRGGSDAAGSIERVAAAHGATTAWGWIGVLGVVAGVLILSFYSVIGGWTLAYAVETAVDGLAGDSPAAVRGRFDALLAAPARASFYHAVFLGLAAIVVARGVSRGIEAASRVLMPLLVALMAALALYAVVQGDLAATLRFLFRLDMAGFTARAALEALGLGFFSIGVGFGLMITYGAYARPDISLRQVAIVSVGVDTAISVLAGFAVFPIVFAHGLDPASGPGLVFVTLPLAFARMPLGTAAAIGFFLLLFVAALGSAISMLELAAAYAMRRFGWTRLRAAAALAAACFTGGLGTVFSMAFFERLDFLTSNVMLPAGALALSVFCGWVLPRAVLSEELRLGPRGAARLALLLRWVAPALIAAATIGGYL